MKNNDSGGFDTFLFTILIIFGAIMLFVVKFTNSEKNKSVNKKRSKRLTSFQDRFDTLESVQQALGGQCGLKTCNLIFGIDFTASNMQQGQRTFGGKSLHSLDQTTYNPYQKVIVTLGETLEVFDEDRMIPAFGFGDSTSRGSGVTSLLPEGKACDGFMGVYYAYSEFVKTAKLSGPTNFAPLIYKTIEIVKKDGGYHILVIVADGQVNEEARTKEAIVEASKYPISIVMVGVGDGPWDIMDTFDDDIEGRQFDNFQFVDYEKVTKAKNIRNADSNFALHALMEIPDQYASILELGLLQDEQQIISELPPPYSESDISQTTCRKTPLH